MLNWPDNFPSSRFSCSSCFGSDTRCDSCGRRMLLCTTRSASKQKVQSRSCFSIPTAAEASTRCSLSQRSNVALLEEVAIADVHQAAARRTVADHRPVAASDDDHQILGGEWNLKEHHRQQWPEVAGSGAGRLRRVRQARHVGLQASLPGRSQCFGGFGCAMPRLTVAQHERQLNLVNRLGQHWAVAGEWQNSNRNRHRSVCKTSTVARQTAQSQNQASWNLTKQIPQNCRSDSN